MASLIWQVDEAKIVSGSPLGEELHKPVERSVLALDEMLGAGWKEKCGLVQVVAEDGTIEWVVRRAPFDLAAAGWPAAHPEIYDGSSLAFCPCSPRERRWIEPLAFSAGGRRRRLSEGRRAATQREGEQPRSTTATHQQREPRGAVARAHATL
jgi:hypothetical protein